MTLIDFLAARYGSDHRRMAEALDRALRHIDQLRLENANLRSENRQLRRLLADRDLRMLRRAHRDALLIGALHFAGGYTSRRQCAMVGITENRWCLARALLTRARILRGAARSVGRISVESAQLYEEQLQAAVDSIAATGDATALKRHSYRHRRRK